MSTETTIFIGVGIYIVLMVAIGMYASGRTHTVTEFIVAGRGLPVWLCSTTIVATWFGGGTMMGASGAMLIVECCGMNGACTAAA